MLVWAGVLGGMMCWVRRRGCQQDWDDSDTDDGHGQVCWVC